MIDLDELYQELILDHFKKPRCQGCIENADASHSLHNPLCGDQVLVSIALEDKAVSDIKFTGKGCAISQASASMMAEACRGKSLETVQTLLSSFKALMRGERKAEDTTELGDIVALEGVRKFAARVRCVLLAWEALERCLAKVAKAEQT